MLLLKNQKCHGTSFLFMQLNERRTYCVHDFYGIRSTVELSFLRYTDGLPKYVCVALACSGGTERTVCLFLPFSALYFGCVWSQSLFLLFTGVIFVKYEHTNTTISV